jgi:uncharacterized protein YndB with AHSA1/START domain
MPEDFIAKAETVIHVPTSKVWEALTDPELVKEYLFGTKMEADWKVGGNITYTGIWEGKKYEDKGHVLEMVPHKKIVTDYWSALSGKPNIPENYQRVMYELFDENNSTRVLITQDGNPTPESAEHSAKNWITVLKSMKELLEKI